MLLRVVCVVLCCVCVSAVSAASDKKIESAKAKYKSEVSKAAAEYAKDVAKAQGNLEKVYKKAISALRKKGQDEAADALKKEFAALVEEGAGSSPGAGAPAKPAVANAHKKLIAAIGNKVVNKDKQAMSSAKTLGNKKHVFLYFSAHWCPPCRTFTPRLVEFYKNNGGGEQFEIVFVSSDRGEAGMYGYMTEASMPWVSVPFSNIMSSRLKETYGGRGIPNLVLLDADGNVVSGSYEDGQYLGPDKALQDYKQLPR